MYIFIENVSSLIIQQFTKNSPCDASSVTKRNAERVERYFDPINCNKWEGYLRVVSGGFIKIDEHSSRRLKVRFVDDNCDGSLRLPKRRDSDQGFASWGPLLPVIPFKMAPLRYDISRMA